LVSDDAFDVLVIGAGQAAMPLVFDLAKAGKRVALAERKYLGGSCVNFGCTPSKAVIASARVAQLARRGREFGLDIPTVTVDFPAVMAGAQAVVRESRDGLAEGFENIDNPTLLRGHARIEGRGDGGFRVRIGDARTITAKQIVLDTGTRARIPEIDGLAGVSCLTADNWIDHTELPESLILLGGGIVGLEMGQFYARMGSKVTIVDPGPRLLPREEPEVWDTLRPLLEAEGIVFQLNAKATGVRSGPDGVTVTVTGEHGPASVCGSHLFLAAGRTPNTADLGLETVGVALTPEGIVTTDKRLSTNVDGIWVAGDIRGGPMFTHTSWDDYRILKSQMIGDGARTTDRLVPYALFTDPQLGRVGLTEAEARKQGKKIGVGHFDMLHNGRAREYRERNGFLKVIVDAETDRLLGATVLSDEAGELVQIYLTLMNADAPYSVIRDSIYIHPTYGEAVQSATESVA
jgi:pyruvate/2-oxoglutarate dehydrogenase complex dihydrolipoamide dehydrogenase (E3) component